MNIENYVVDDPVSSGILSRNFSEVGLIETRQQHSAPKKISLELRGKRITFQQERRWYKRIPWRWKEDSQFLRTNVQVAFAFLCLWIGIEFSLFVRWGTTGGQESFFQRPPGAEGFLPISALLSLKYWLLTGMINTIHPAGLFIFVAALLMGLFLKKAFCSWLCPIGTLSESLWMFGSRLFGNNFTAPRWLDYPLRSLKYLLLLFFAFTIWQMDVDNLRLFIESPYNRVADIKMYVFFAHMTSFALWTIIILIIFSVFIKNFWCRYLCPYGALLGALSWLSPLKITRKQETCIDCELCTKVCPANIMVHQVRRVWSDECTNCLQCVEVCPVKNTLDVRTSATQTRVPTPVFGALVVGTFILVTGFAILTGHWQNNISKEEYLKHFRQLDSPFYQHNRGQVPHYQSHVEQSSSHHP